MQNSISPTRFSGSLLGCALGQAVGASLGIQRHGSSAFASVTGFNPLPPAMPSIEEIDYQILWADVVSKGGRPGSGALLCAAYKQNPLTGEDASAFALYNMRRGLTSPASGSCENPYFESFAPAGRSPIWACLSPGDSAEAARLAGIAAMVDHGGEAVFAAMFSAACLSAAFVAPSVPKSIGTAMKMIPFDSATANCVRAAITAVQSGLAGEEAKLRIDNAAGTCDTGYGPLNVGYFVLSLLLGNGDFGQTILAAASFGGATRQTAGLAGAFVGILRGDEAISDEWRAVIGDKLTSGWSKPSFKLPKTAGDWAKLMEALAMRLPRDGAPTVVAEPPAPPIAEPVEGAADPEPAPPAPDPLAALQDNSLCQPFWSLTPYSQVLEQANLRVTFESLDPPFVRPGRSNRLRVLVENIGKKELGVEPAITGPEGWALAARPQSAKLWPGATYEFAAVVQCPPDANPGDASLLNLKLGTNEFNAALLKRRGWVSVGPFRNDEGMGYEKYHKPEDVYRRDEVFMLRSGIPGKWTPVYFDGPWMPIEDAFNSSAGVIYYRTILESGEARKVRIVAATDHALIIWVNRQKMLWYREPSVAFPRPRRPYVVEGTLVAGANELMLKVVRGNEPIRGLWFYVLGEDGQIPEDIRFDETKA